MIYRRLTLLVIALLLAPLVAACGAPQAAKKPTEIRLDYAYYNPSSLVLRKFGWLEEELGKESIGVKWILSAGSNKANEYLRSDAVDFGSTAGSAALLARANGSAIQAVYIYSKPEWAAPVGAQDSPIADAAPPKGKKVAATKGPDPYFFLLQTLHKAGLTAADVEVVNLQHNDGKVALERGQVDAWSGLDPHMAQSELEAGSRLIYRNIDFNTYGFLNAREDFVGQYPALTTRVLTQYERARRWILENSDEAAQILAEEAKISLEVADRELRERTVLTTSPVPGEEHAAVLRAVIPIFEAEEQVRPGTDVEAALGELLAPEF